MKNRIASQKRGMPQRPMPRLSRPIKYGLLSVLVVALCALGYWGQIQPTLNSTLVHEGYRQYVTTRSLLLRGAQANATDDYRRPALTMAASVGNGESVELLLASGADVNARDSLGETPLLCASGKVAEILIAHGADVNATDRAGHTALMEAVSVADEATALELIKMLLQHGADVNARDSTGHTALGRAMGGKRPAIVAALRQVGATP